MNYTLNEKTIITRAHRDGTVAHEQLIVYVGKQTLRQITRIDKLDQAKIQKQCREALNAHNLLNFD